MIHEGLGGQNNLLLAVFDGHGQEGDKVSRHVAATLPGLMANSSAFRVWESISSQILAWLLVHIHARTSWRNRNATRCGLVQDDDKCC